MCIENPHEEKNCMQFRLLNSYNKTRYSKDLTCMLSFADKILFLDAVLKITGCRGISNY